MNEELKIIIRAELAQFKKAMNEAVSGLKQVANESRKASKEVDGFTADVNQQGKALSDLKKKYVDLAAAHGKESKEAKDAADAIKKLSAEYKKNKALVDDLSNSANSFDSSFGGQAKENVEGTTDSVENLQGTLESIKALDFATLLVGLVGPEVKKKLDSAKEWFAEYRVFMGQARGSLNRNSSYYGADGVEWEGWKGALGNWKANFSEAMGSASKGFKKMGEAGKEAMAGLEGGMASLIVALAILVADILIIIGLFRNALSVAKEVKTMANLASKAGMETSAYQEWGYVLKQVGIEEDKLVDFTKKLAERQNELRNGSEEVAKAFEEIGLSQKEVLGSSQEELFSKSVAGLQNIENEAERTSLAFRIFSDDATDLANVLYLTNQETKSLIDNYYALGAAPSDNLINKSKILEGSTTNLSYAWQGLKNTLAEWVIPVVITLVQWITTAVAWLNIFLSGIFGIQTASKSSGLENVSKGANKVGSSAKKATGAIKEMLRYTMGFDELNVIPKQSGGSGSTGANGYSSTAINPDLPVIEIPDMSKFKAFMNEYGSIIQGIVTWSLIGIGVLLAVLGFMHGNIAMGILGISLAGLGIGIGAAGGEESHWSKLGKAITDTFSGLFQSLKPVWDAIVNLITSAWKLIKAVWDHSTIKVYFEALWLYVQAVFATASVAISGYFKLAWEAIKLVWNNATGYFAAIWNSIASIYSAVERVLRGDFEGAWNAIKGIVGIWAGYFKNVWKNIKEAFGNVKSFFTGAFSDAWDGMTEKWKNLGNFFKGIINGMIETVEKGINFIIKKINTLSWNVPEWVPVIGGEKWGFNFKNISIPRLETGGVATHSILANIGERGREAVLPLDNHTEWMDVLANRINGRSAPTKIVLMVDGRELGYAAINSINGITKQTGTLQLQLV